MEHAPGEKAGSSGAGEAMGSGARGAGKGALQNQGRWRHPKSNWMRTGADCAGGESAKVPELELAVRRRTSLPKNARGGGGFSCGRGDLLRALLTIGVPRDIINPSVFYVMQDVLEALEGEWI